MGKGKAKPFVTGHTCDTATWHCFENKIHEFWLILIATMADFSHVASHLNCNRVEIARRKRRVKRDIAS